MEKRKKEVEVFVASDNIYADFGFPSPSEALSKARLAQMIFVEIKRRKLTQKQAAELMDIDQPKVSDIIRGKLTYFSIDRLMELVNRMGIELVISPHYPKGKAKAGTLILPLAQATPSKQHRTA